ncbi:hypothetical protein ARMGADRAFT_483510 [Armillaria gallica]|uniref:Uncharacterized protein n=1 Tax=Armillaria gallica TaxID=47427 RepID=A0A2H3DUM4_ARMGA|nr:hypothetical protein ARMGADRAFT_483510 [Armillaria gallica]
MWGVFVTCANVGLLLQTAGVLDGEWIPYWIAGAATGASEDDSKNRDWGFEGRTNEEGERMPIEADEDTVVWMIGLASADTDNESWWLASSEGALYGSRKMGFVACSDKRHADKRTYTTLTLHLVLVLVGGSLAKG